MKSGEPIIGANVIEKGTANGTVTDMDGKYTLEVSSSTVVLQLSYIGYLTKGKATHLPFIKDGQEVHLALFLKQKTRASGNNPILSSRRYYRNHLAIHQSYESRFQPDKNNHFSARFPAGTGMENRGRLFQRLS